MVSCRSISLQRSAHQAPLDGSELLLLHRAIYISMSQAVDNGRVEEPPGKPKVRACSLYSSNYFFIYQAYSFVNPSTGGCNQFFSSYFRSSTPSMIWNV